LYGCADGFYYLVPHPDESSFVPDKTTATKAVVESDDVTVTIQGGAIQKPGRNIKAAHLKTLIAIESTKSFTYHTLQPSIYTNEQVNIPAASLYVTYIPVTRDKRENIARLLRKENDTLDYRIFTFEPGIAEINYNFSSYYNGLGFIQYPIFLEAGMVDCDGDTLSLQKLLFDAAVKPDEYGDK
jgi:hypothetical protein